MTEFTHSSQAARETRQILFHLYKGQLCTHVVRRSPNLAIGILIDTPFIDRIIRGIYSVTPKVVVWHPSQVAILTRNQHKEKEPNTHVVSYDNQNDKHISDTEGSFQVRIARQNVLKSNMQHHVPITTTLSGLPTIERHHFQSRRNHVLVARGMMEASPDNSFYVLDRNFSRNEVRLPKCVGIVIATRPSDIPHAIDSINKKLSFNGEIQG